MKSGKRKVTKEVADFIYKSFKTRTQDTDYEEKLENILADIKSKFKIEIKRGTVEFYCYKTFDEIIEYQKRKRNERNNNKKYDEEESRLRNPDRYDFLKSFENFENQKQIRQINLENKYVKSMVAMHEYDIPLDGNKLSDLIGEESVRFELRDLKMKGLIKSSTRIKSQLSEKGKAYLKAIKAI